MNADKGKRAAVFSLKKGLVFKPYDVTMNGSLRQRLYGEKIPYNVRRKAVDVKSILNKRQAIAWDDIHFVQKPGLDAADIVMLRYVEIGKRTYDSVIAIVEDVAQDKVTLRPTHYRSTRHRYGLEEDVFRVIRPEERESIIKRKNSNSDIQTIAIRVRASAGRKDLRNANAKK